MIIIKRYLEEKQETTSSLKKWMEILSDDKISKKEAESVIEAMKNISSEQIDAFLQANKENRDLYDNIMKKLTISIENYMTAVLKVEGASDKEKNNIWGTVKNFLQKLQTEKQKLTTEDAVETPQTLQPTEQEIATMQEFLKQSDVQKMIKKIDEDPKLKDPWLNKVAVLIKNWKYMEAVKVWFELIMNAIFSGKDGKTALGFPQFAFLNEDIQKLDLSTKSPAELLVLKDEFTKKIADADSVKRRISYTYIVSHIIDTYEKKDNPHVNKMQIVEKQLQVWSVLLLNKQNTGIWGKLLQWISDNDVDMTHVIVITEKWPPTLFSHATEHKYGNNAQSWVETNVPLWDYLKWNYADLVITNPPEIHRQKALERAKNIKNDEVYQYSKTAAATWVLGMKQIEAWKFNCWTYVQEVLGLDWQGMAVPNNWLSDRRLQPSYMVSFNPKEQWS